MEDEKTPQEKLINWMEYILLTKDTFPDFVEQKEGEIFKHLEKVGISILKDFMRS